MRRVAGYNIPVTVNSMCGGFAAERRAGDIDRDSGGRRSSRALGSDCGQ